MFECLLCLVMWWTGDLSTEQCSIVTTHMDSRFCMTGRKSGTVSELAELLFHTLRLHHIATWGATATLWTSFLCPPPPAPLFLSFSWVEMLYGAVSWMRKVSGLTFGWGIARICNLYVVLFSLIRVGCYCFFPFPFQFIFRQWSGLRCHAVRDVPCPNVSGEIGKKSAVACLTAGVTEWLRSIIKTADKTAGFR